VFRTDQPVAWAFHRNTSRWLHNSIDAPPDREGVPRAPKEFPDAEFVALPSGKQGRLDDLVRSRVSCRRFDAAGISLSDFADVLRTGYGVTGTAALGALEFLERPVPSGGGLYPLEVYAVVRAVDGLTPGVYHFAPVTEGVERLREVALPSRFLTYLFMGQSLAAEAAAVLVITAVTQRSLAKYSDRGYRYLLIEAGHVGQNIALAAVERGLGTCSLGGFFDDELAALLTVDIDYELPLYALALGRPADADRRDQRAFGS
jgi:SagB-type dehydrogenase family enzyme